MRRDRHLPLLLCVLAACTDPERPEAQPPAVVAPAASPGDARVVATVNGSPILLEEVADLAAATGLSPLDALRRLEEERALASEAERAGLGDDREVRRATERAAVQALLADRVEDPIRPETIPADAVAERIRSTASRFEGPERRRALHVLARLPADASDEARAAAERFVRRAIERLQAADDPAAEARSLEAEDDPARAFRIVVEALPLAPREGPFVGDFAAGMFSIPGTGVVPHPVRTQFGLHAIVVQEVVPAWRAPADEVDAFVRRELATEARAARLDELAARLAERTPVQLVDETVLRERLGQPLDEATP